MTGHLRLFWFFVAGAAVSSAPGVHDVTHFSEALFALFIERSRILGSFLRPAVHPSPGPMGAVGPVLRVVSGERLSGDMDKFGACKECHFYPVSAHKSDSPCSAVAIAPPAIYRVRDLTSDRRISISVFNIYANITEKVHSENQYGHCLTEKCIHADKVASPSFKD
jgi:hypothetical protein